MSLAAAFLLHHSIAIGGGEIPSEFSYRSSIVKTRHNMTQSGAETVPGKTITAVYMDIYRSDYGEVCVYCHTPHGANFLVCLSCHDGQTAIDSIMNMPGSGKYSAAPDNAFLDTWPASHEGHAPLGQIFQYHHNLILPMRVRVV